MFYLCLIYERRKKRPTKKVNIRVRPPETKVWRQQGRIIFDWTAACFFSRRHAGHDLGVDYTRIGPNLVIPNEITPNLIITNYISPDFDFWKYPTPNLSP